jgi:hypothetical protein
MVRNLLPARSGTIPRDNHDPEGPDFSQAIKISIQKNDPILIRDIYVGNALQYFIRLVTPASFALIHGIDALGVDEVSSYI